MSVYALALGNYMLIRRYTSLPTILCSGVLIEWAALAGLLVEVSLYVPSDTA